MATTKSLGTFTTCLAAALLASSGAHAATPTALYYGGPVTENAKVYVVWWGDPAKINPVITVAKGGIADFYAGVLNSSYMDWLNVYNTTGNAQAGSHNGMAGTGQRIGRGNYAGTLTLANVPTGNVTDAQVQSTIDQALDAGTLPPPDDNTLYAIYFPKAVSISLDGTTSCHGFGAYHNFIMESQRHAVYYAVMPDCGGSFSSITSVSSHELMEAISDTVPTAGNMPDYPQAWNDSMGSEIGDLCEGPTSAAPVMTAFGTFTVQKMWDERSKSCTAFSSDANDFNVAISPNAASVPLNGTMTFMIQTATSAGSPQMLSLSANAPTGVSATVSPTMVMSGGTATLTVTATNPSAQTGLQVVVRADAGAGSTVQTHTAALLLKTTSAPVDLGAPAMDLGVGAADLATPPAGEGTPGDDLAVGGGVGGGGAQPGTSKGCGCVIGAAAGPSASPLAALVMLALVALASRRRARRRRR